MLKDLRCGVRILLKSPGFTGGAILTLALGVGANIAIDKWPGDCSKG